jgi:D-alanine--poly(phosphoribitol) ligase subunit 1
MSTDEFNGMRSLSRERRHAMSDDAPPKNAAEYFLHSAETFPDHPALWLDGREYRYREILGIVARLAETLRALEGDVCAVLGERSLSAYCAPLACMLSGKIYLPLGANFPMARMANILARATPSILILDPASEEKVPTLLAHVDHPMRVVMPESKDCDTRIPLPFPHDYAEPIAQHGDGAGLQPATSASPIQTRTAYLLFTSGSTGQPKGVAVGHAALCEYVEATLDRYPEMDEHQRCSQFFESTFDLSLHDLFVTWAAGACLYSIPKKELLMPIEFANRHRLTVWFSVPSMAAALQRYRLLTPDALPLLKLALFCGEALSAGLAAAWLSAAPNARCENLYGPTEATIACTAFRFDAAPAGMLQVVPIGMPFPNMEIAVLGDDDNPVDQGSIGELYLGGTQLAIGYWRDSGQTEERFIERTIPGKTSRRWYRTGDLASIDTDRIAHFHGRADRQIKLRGYRIELQEVESLLREICGTSEVAAVAIPAQTGEPLAGIAAFVVTPDRPKGELVAAMKTRLPSYMVPSETHCIDALPLNSNGKTDYRALTDRLRLSQAAASPARRTAKTTEQRSPAIERTQSPTSRIGASSEPNRA